MHLNRNPCYAPAGTPEAHAVQRVIEHLDDIAAGYEARWGVDRLPKLAHPELRQKWESQTGKLNDAIDRNHPLDVETLALGMQRGWKALEDYALSQGHKPIDPDAWETWHPSGRIYRIVKNNPDAAACPARPDALVVTLQSVVNIYHAVMTGKLETSPEVKKIMQENIPLPNGGDSLPF